MSPHTTPTRPSGPRGARALLAALCAIALVMPAGQAGAWIEGSAFQQVGPLITPTSPPDLHGSFALDVRVSGDGRVVGLAGARFGPGLAAFAEMYTQDDAGDWQIMGAPIELDEDVSQDLSLSADGSRVAVRIEDAGAARVEIFAWTGQTWVRDGDPLTEPGTYSGFGENLAMSSDGLSLLIPPFLYVKEGEAWVRSRQFSYSTNQNGTISADGTVVAIQGSTLDTVQVEVRDADGAWQPQGSVTLPESIGVDVALSEDGDRLAVGSAYAGDQRTGVVRVFENIGGEWQQVGAGIVGDGPDHRFGRDVELSADGSIVTAVAEGCTASGSWCAQQHQPEVRTFAYDGTAWVQLGPDLEHTRRVGMSNDGRTFATHHESGGAQVNRLVSPPVLTVTDAATTVGTPVQIHATATDLDGGAVSLEYDLGDGFGPDATFSADAVGTFDVAVRATDDERQVTTATATVEVTRPVGRELLRQAIDAVSAAQSHAPGNKDLDKAGEHLADADDDALWDGDTLVADDGKDVLKDLEKAAKDLLKALDTGDLNEEATAAVESALADLVDLVLQQVQSRSDDLTALDLTDPDDIADRDEALEKAAKDRDKGDEKLADGDIDKAIHHWTKAWKHLDDAFDDLT